MSNTQLTAQQVLEQLEKLKRDGADLSQPLLVYIPGDDTGDFIENGAYELYSSSYLQTDANNKLSLVVEPVGGA